MKKSPFLLLVIVLCFKGFAQNDSLVSRLEEVVIQADKKLHRHSVGFKAIALNDSTILKNTESFSALLRFNSPLYIKEQGAGGASSVSFRGTSASNTAVIWNGVNINSINTGQTDFNALTVNLFDGIDIRSGGGSIEYGSGAVGGTIHLNDNLQFTKSREIKNQIVTTIGSFQTYQGLYKAKLSDSKHVINFGLSYNESENDYKFLGTDFKNENGAYQNLALNGSASFLLSSFSNLKFYSSNYSGERLFSGELPNPLAANDKYQDINHRNLVVFTHEKSRLNQEVKLAFLTQEYRYFNDKRLNVFSYGKSSRYIVNYDVSYRFPKLKAAITSYSEYESAFGETDRIESRNRRQFSKALVYNQNVNKNLFFEVKARKDFNSDYAIPLTYAFGMKVKHFQNLFLRVNGSKNFRVPTYNDLFWPGQGNLDLIPETALQGELGIGYKTQKFLMDFAVFYIDTKDKIIWTPNGDSSRPGVWVPMNLSETNNKGIEIASSYKENFGRHTVNLNAHYSYTIATNKETAKQLIFVPKHLFKVNVGYAYKRYTMYFQQLVNGAVYTTESNSNDFVIPYYSVVNLGLDYKVLDNIHHQLNIGVKVNNILNENYVVIPRRPMPNRNINFNINYKF